MTTIEEEALVWVFNPDVGTIQLTARHVEHPPGTVFQTPEERINQLRRIIHIHSILYYHFNHTIVTDFKFDEWCKELVKWMKERPDYISEGYEPDLFKDFTGDTGMHLPVSGWALSRASSYLTLGHF